MELRQLRYFTAVVDEGGFTRAAAALHVAQPGVSAQVRQLERELGAELFDRTGRGVTLTAVGEAVLPYAREALAAAEAVRGAVDELTGLVRGRVRLGVIAVPSMLDLPGLLADFHSAYPGVEVSMHQIEADRLVAGILAGTVDLGVVSYGTREPAGLRTRTVIDQAVVAAVAPGDPLAAARSVSLAALGERALIALPRGTGLRRIVEEAFAAEGIEPHVAFEAAEPYVLAQLAAKGMGVALLPESAVAGTEAVAVPLRPAVRGRIGLAWRAEGPVSPAARALIGLARERWG